MKHTPGPWKVTKHKDSECYSIHYGDQPQTEEGDNSVAGVWDISPKGLANAKLIAAAPDLLDALEKCIIYIPAFIKIGGDSFDNEHGREIYDEAKSAINKAKGL